MNDASMDVIEWSIVQACAEVDGERVCSSYATWTWPETGEEAQCSGDDEEDAARRMRLAWWKRYGDRVFAGQDLPADEGSA